MTVQRIEGEVRTPRPSDVVFYAEDSPEAQGAQPQPGSANYRFDFPLDDGRTLFVNVGVEGFKALSGIIHAIEADEARDGS